MKTKTIDLKGKAYAQVKDRLQQFRQECPHGLIETAPTIQPDGSLLFKARILKDKGDAASPEATRHAFGKATGEKAFEKLETIAVGRALALLGYAADGEIASSEEMEEFLAHKSDVENRLLATMTKRLEGAKNHEELKTVWASVPGTLRVQLQPLKDQLKSTYANA